MLKITVPGVMLHDPTTDRIFRIKETELTLEYSLVSLSKWESKWHKPFINREHSLTEFDDFIRHMTVTQNVDPNVYFGITPEIRKQVQDYMDDSMTAAIIKEDKSRSGGSQFLTSDLIYAWMVELRIPFECQKWHLNRLITLIRIVNIERQPKKKKSAAEVAREHAMINKTRRAARKH